MKNKKFLWTALPFVAGAIFGISLLGLLSFTGQSKSPGPSPAITRINVQDAHSYFKNYIGSIPPSASNLNGFTVDLAELTSMNSILLADPSAAGFRFYFGIDASRTGILIVCGVDASGTDMTGNIYSVTTDKAGLCPPVCDQASPITH